MHPDQGQQDVAAIAFVMRQVESPQNTIAERSRLVDGTSDVWVARAAGRPTGLIDGLTNFLLQLFVDLLAKHKVGFFILQILLLLLEKVGGSDDPISEVWIRGRLFELVFG